ncbi:activator of Hsp70 and Hsp90 chaperone [Multifurca ochricompacta]|uniref:Activator of Hsp70 and Hsp90 chaperone n=1 Tax=Multifurca ochricompacta TaxID=376703 RepID=A0AAD4QL90_9AGAM|nr:activator of Hsp70 and Hsp90 chaperone [Multifurca ochricompacta]
MAEALKAEGNKAFAAKDYDRAINLFSKALDLDQSNFVLWSNRSAAKAGKRDWDGALEDADQCIKANPTWPKGYARKGAALHGQRRYDEAIEAYELGLKIEDSPAIRKGYEEVKAAKAADERDDGTEALGIGKMFSDPGMLAKLAANPRTAKHLADASFMQKLQLIQKNPQIAQSLLNSDPRMIDVLGALMGFDMQGFSRPEGSDDLPPGVPKSAASTSFPSSSPPPYAKPTSTPSASSSYKAPESVDVEMAGPEKVETDDEEDEGEDEDAVAKAAAEAEKVLGTGAYKKRDLEAAITHFSKAWERWPKDVTYLTNLGAAYFEKGEYDKSIEACQKAVDEGRDLRTDYKLIAKAYGRIGSAYAKKDDLANAIRFFEKSLTEHRTPDVLNKLKDVERTKAAADRAAYVNPALSAAAREEGNRLFKEGDFAGAVKSYTESINRDPSDARGYNNRALAYTKLVALPEALKDVEEAIRVDPTFVKAHIRKASVLFALREYTKALEALEVAREQDETAGSKSTREIQDLAFKVQSAISSQRANETEQETMERAMRDPEVAGIMTDPVMQSILQQAQTNPQALQDHMKNPTVRNKIVKLINAGIIKTR